MTSVPEITDDWFNAYYEKPETDWNTFKTTATCKTCRVAINTKVVDLKGHVDYHVSA